MPSRNRNQVNINTNNTNNNTNYSNLYRTSDFLSDKNRSKKHKNSVDEEVGIKGPLIKWEKKYKSVMEKEKERLKYVGNYITEKIIRTEHKFDILDYVKNDKKEKVYEY